jgi:hypothetical protein
MNEIINVRYLGKIDYEGLQSIPQVFYNQLERYKDYDDTFYILELGKRLPKNTPSRTYALGDIIAMQRSSDSVDFFIVKEYIPNEFYVIRIEQYIPEKPFKKVGY